MKKTSTDYPQKEIEELKSKLGKSTWTMLHSFAAAYPIKPSEDQKLKAKNLVDSISVLYPCKPCAIDFQEYIQKRPPQTDNKISFSIWLCEAHNEVNQKLGRSAFNCSNVWKKWGGKEYIEEDSDNEEEDDLNCGKFCADTLGKEQVQLLEEAMKGIKNKKYKL
eukprot:gene4109-7395_t